jgi:hypothetical protein
LSLEKRQCSWKLLRAVISGVLGGFGFPGTEKKVAGKRIYREKSSRNVSPRVPFGAMAMEK